MTKPRYVGNQSLDELISSWEENDWNGQEWEDSRLREYLSYDLWSSHIGLCTLSGFDYLTSEKGNHSGPAQFNFASALSPTAFMSYMNGNRAAEEHLLSKMNEDIDRLCRFWENSGNAIEGRKYPPAYFITWALSKRFCPDWLNWAIEKKLYIPRQETDKASVSEPELAKMQAVPGGTVTASDALAATRAPVTVIEAPVAPLDAPVVSDPKPLPSERTRAVDALKGLIDDAAYELGSGATAASVSTKLFGWAMGNAKPGRLLTDTTNDVLQFKDGRYTKIITEKALKQRIRRFLKHQDS